MPSAFAVLRMLEGFQYAASITISTVPSLISELAPPMMPAIDTSRSASQTMTAPSGSECVLPSSVVNGVPPLAFRTMIRPPRSSAWSNACKG